jgi:hypothetical protein
MKVFTGFGGDQKKAVKTEMTADSPNSGAKAIMQDDKRINDNAMLNYQDSINAGIQKTNINR